MNSKIVYHLRMVKCGKARCRQCREGTGHGPYWYAHENRDGHIKRTYIGKELPPGVQMSQEPVRLTALLRVFTFGRFRIERRTRTGDQQWQAVPDAAWQQQEEHSLLGLLISNPERRVSHTQIQAALWPDVDPKVAASLVERSVSALRQLLEPAQRYQKKGFIVRSDEPWLTLADQAHLWTDVDAFEALLKEARATGDLEERERLFEQATALYAGDYLPGVQLETVVARRTLLQRSWIGLLLELADRQVEQGSSSVAIDLLDRLLATDPTNEAATLRLMVILARSRRRGEALRVYKRFMDMLGRVGELHPSEELQQLYEVLRRGEHVSFPKELVHRAKTIQNGHSSLRDSIPLIGRTHQQALIGRDHEQALLRTMLQGVEHIVAGKPARSQRELHCILLRGEAGLGKTRLAEEVGHEAVLRGWTVAWGHAYAQETSMPYRMWIEALRMALAQNPGFEREVVAHATIYQPLLALLPELQDLLPSHELATTGSHEQEQLRLWDAAIALLTIVSKRVPLCIILDDLQWADRSSIDLLGYLVRNLDTYPLMLVGICRESDLPRDHPLRSLLADLERTRCVETLTIGPLTDSQIASMLSHLPSAMVRHIQTRAAGNPFFAEELARSVQDLTTMSTDQQLVLPATIAAALDSRLAKLSPACQQLLSKAAIFGGAFQFAWICAVLELPASGSNEDVVLDLLEEALRAGMLVEENTGTGIGYHFWHPLLLDHLYDSLSATRRMSLHRRAAAVLREAYQGREEEGAAAIVYHLKRCGAASSQIAQYAELAGNRAYALSAYPEAEQQYRLAVQHWEALPADASREDWLHLAYLLERLGECTRVQGNGTEARRCFEQALAVHSRHLLSASHTDALHEAQIDALLLCEMGKTWFDMGDYGQARECYHRGEQVLHEAEVATGPAWASLYLEQSYIRWEEGDIEGARQTAHQALAAFEQVLQPQRHPIADAFHSTMTRRTLEGNPVDLGRAHTLLAALAATEGQSSIALGHLSTALGIFEQYGRQREVAIVSCNLGDLYLRQVELELAQSALHRALGIAQRIGLNSTMAATLGNLGVLAWRRGSLAEAEEWCRRGLLVAEQINDPIYISLLHSYLTTVMQEQGKWDEARSSLRRALMIGRAMNNFPCIGVALMALGQLRIAQAQVAPKNERGLARALQREQKNGRIRLLIRARSTLVHALSQRGLEAEMSIEGQLALAEVALLLGELEQAHQQAMRVMDEARRYQLVRLLASSQRLLGSILTAQDELEQADGWFMQAIASFRKYGMRLEWARTLHSYGQSLLHRVSAGEVSYQQGSGYLQEAYQVFRESNAFIDLQAVSRLLSRSSSTEQSDADMAQ